MDAAPPLGADGARTSFATFFSSSSSRTASSRENDWNSNLLALGEFNLEGPGTPLYQAFVSTGLFPPGQLSTLPRTIFDSPDRPHSYDQVAWFSSVDDAGQVKSMLSGMEFTGNAGNFDFLPHVFHGMSKMTQVSWRISDHYPLWVEFRLTGP